MVRKSLVKLVLKLHAKDYQPQSIAAGQGISRHSIALVLEAADRLNISWQEVAALPEHEVYELLFLGSRSIAACMLSPMGHGPQGAGPRWGDAGTVA